MLADSLTLVSLWSLIGAAAIALAAGFVKGAIGFALPLIIVSGLSLFLDPLIAISGVILPALVSNIVQTARHSVTDIIDALNEHWRYILIVCVMIVIVAQFVTIVPEQSLYLIIGIPVVILSLVQLLGLRFSIPESRKRAAEWLVGAVSGAIGGFTGTWGPTTVLYLIALQTPKARQMLVQGVVYGLGSVSLLVGHISSGVLNWATAPFSAALLIPTFIGMRIGFRLGDRLDPDRFRQITLIVLVISGANLVRRGIFG